MKNEYPKRQYRRMKWNHSLFSVRRCAVPLCVYVVRVRSLVCVWVCTLLHARKLPMSSSSSISIIKRDICKCRLCTTARIHTVRHTVHKSHRTHTVSATENQALLLCAYLCVCIAWQPLVFSATTARDSIKILFFILLRTERDSMLWLLANRGAFAVPP